MHSPKYLIPILLLASLPASAATLFDNGVPSGDLPYGGNFLDCSLCRSPAGNHIYDNFSVVGQTWSVTGLYGTWLYIFSQTLPLTADWEIRTGVGQGVDGTLIAFGNASLGIDQLVIDSASQTFRGTVVIPTLILGPGTYWINISPVTPGQGETYLEGTNGVGGVHAVSDGLSFVKGTNFPQMKNIGDYIASFSSDQSGADYAYGVTGQLTSAVPEPACWLLSAVGLVGLLARARRR